MEKEKQSASRRKFLFWGAGLLSGLSLFRFGWLHKPPKKRTVKMLTREGQLVEVEVSRLPEQRKKIQHKELLGWVTKNHPAQ